MKRYVKINWSPFRTNVLDAGEYKLILPDGSPVEFRRGGSGEFILKANGQIYETRDNLEMSYTMNTLEVGADQ